MNTKRPFGILLITLALLGISFSEALAKEVVKATVAGPGLAGEIDLSDPKDLEVVGAPWLDLRPADQPVNLQNASYYSLHLEIGSPEEVGAINVFHYYPGGDDKPGYFFFAECQGCSGSFKTWYGISNKDDSALRQLLVRLGAPAALIGSPKQSGTKLDSVSSSLTASTSNRTLLFRQDNLVLVSVLALLLLSLIAFAFLQIRKNKSTLNG